MESALYILAGIALYGGGHHLYLGARRSGEHPHVLHGVMYLLLCAFAIASALSYEARSVASLIPIGKLGVSAGLLLWGVLAWFVGAFTSLKPRLLLAVLTVAWSLLFIGNMGAPFSLLYSEVTPLSQTLPSGQLQVALHTRVNPWWTVVQLAMLASLLFALYAAFRLYRSDEKRAALALGSGLLVLGGASVSDALVNAGQVQSAFLSPFGFLVLLVAASVYPSLQPARKAAADKEPPANYNVTFHLNEPARGDTPPFTRAPARRASAVEIEHALQAEITHQESRPPFAFTPFDGSHGAAAPSRTESGETTKAEAAPAKTGKESARQPQATAATAAALDESALTEVSDNLIDIAVYATMAMNRFKRGDASPQAVEALCKKVRTQAIATRRIATRMMHPEPDKESHESKGPPSPEQEDA